MWENLAGVLQDLYIGGDNDLYRLPTIGPASLVRS
jgi:hypothetical protein